MAAERGRGSVIDSRPVRIASLLLAGLFVTLWLVSIIVYVARGDLAYQGADYQLYMDATARWLSGGPFYEPAQLAGPYPITHGAILYPPLALPLFVAFQFLPAALWWVVPIGGTVLMIAYHRPLPIALAAIALCLWFPANSPKLFNGNPVMWAMLATALGTRWAAAAPWALIKPSLFPFALVHVNRRSWWISMAGIILLTLLMWPLMVEWMTAVSNGVSPGGLMYSAQEVPMMAIPILAWVGGVHSPGRRQSSSADPGFTAPDSPPAATPQG